MSSLKSGIVGTTGTPYVLGRKISHGAEGDIYLVCGKPDTVVKIYRSKDLDSYSGARIKNKLKFMIKTPVERLGMGHPTFAWPVEALFSGGKLVGFAMPRITGMQGIISAYTPTERKRLFENYTWKHAVYVARNVAHATAHLHSHNVVKGDWNPKDILVNRQCRVSFIDCDSFDMSLLAAGCKCVVYWGEMLAPELQGQDPKTARFTKQTDCFSLAVLVFQLLMDGFHPFSTPVRDSANPIAENIAYGRCAYVSSKITTPPGAPDPRVLPNDIKGLFYRCFAYTKDDVRNGNAAKRRPTAAEWAAALDRLIASLNSKSASVCPKGHVHLKAPWLKGSYNGCPFCEQAARRKTKRSSQARIKAGATSRQRSTGASGKAPPVSRIGHVSKQLMQTIDNAVLRLVSGIAVIMALLARAKRNGVLSLAIAAAVLNAVKCYPQMPFAVQVILLIGAAGTLIKGALAAFARKRAVAAVAVLLLLALATLLPE